MFSVRGYSRLFRGLQCRVFCRPNYASGRPRQMGEMSTHLLGDVTRATAFVRVSLQCLGLTVFDCSRQRGFAVGVSQYYFHCTRRLHGLHWEIIPELHFVRGEPSVLVLLHARSQLALFELSARF